MNIPLPFSLVTSSAGESRREVMPAYYWMYNMYALERNSWKFRARDKRRFREQHIETAYLAPDTAGEIIRALGLLETWAGGVPQEGRELIVRGRVLERSDLGVKILKPAQGYRAYRDMLLYYGVKTLLEYFASGGLGPESFPRFQAAHPEAASMEWLNLGGQLVPEAKARALRESIRAGGLNSWPEIHRQYDRFWEEYPLDKALNALQALRFLEGSEAPIGPRRWNGLLDKALELSRYIEEEVYRTKLKDYDDPFRAITYRNQEERDAVLGPLEKNPFVAAARESAKTFAALIAAARPPDTEP
jgi:hypothetical protein